MKVDISTFLSAVPEKIEEQVKTSKLLVHVASPILKFIPCDTEELPEQWLEGEYWVHLRLLGFIPFGKHAIVISFPEYSNGFSIRDNGYGKIIKQWDHTVTIEPSKNGTLYRDKVEINAGLLTIFVWAFAQVFYRHRQGRWRRLSENNFDFTRG